MSTSQEAQAEELARFRFWRGSLILAVLLALPAELGIGVPVGQRIRSDIPFVTIALLAVTVVVYAGIRIWLFRCPRCGEHFTSGDIQIPGGPARYGRPFTSKCVNCGLLAAGGQDRMRPN